MPDFNNQIKNLCQSFDLLQEITALFQSFSPELKQKEKRKEKKKKRKMKRPHSKFSTC